MANRAKGGRAGTPNKTATGLAKVLQAATKAQQQAKQNNPELPDGFPFDPDKENIETNDEQTVSDGKINFSVTKPDSQEINADYLQWQWKIAPNIFVESTYWLNTFEKDDENYLEEHLAGTYEVGFIFDTKDYFSPDCAREFAQALLSAAEWENSWPNYMGEFLVVKPSDAMFQNVVNNND